MRWTIRRSPDSWVTDTIDTVSEALGIPLFGTDQKAKIEHAKRLAWSLAGRRMLASLFDETENNAGRGVSITHAKRAFAETHAACCAVMLPETECNPLGLKESSTLAADEAFAAYRDAGFFRKSSRWVKSAPPLRSFVEIQQKWFGEEKGFANPKKAFLLRGVGPGLEVQMSGLGPWVTEKKWCEINTANSIHISSVSSRDFIGSSVETMDKGWLRLLRDANWKRVRQTDLLDCEIFVFISPGTGCWQPSTDVKEFFPSCVSRLVTPESFLTLARLHLAHATHFFLCRKNQGELELAQLSMVDAFRRNEWLLMASLSMGMQPICAVSSKPAAVSELGIRQCKVKQFVRVKLSMRPSVEIESFLRVYSWPADMDAPRMWDRIMPASVFANILPCLLQESFKIVPQQE